MGLRAVTLGHAFAPVIDAVSEQLRLGANFTRPAPIEVECAELLRSLIASAEMVKFCKDGSHAVDGAIRLARAYTGREMLAICGDHPFFSTSDWFIGTTEMNAGIPESTRRQVVKFRYNDLASLESLLQQYQGQIAAVIMEPARIDEPQPGYLEQLKSRVNASGALLIFDEMITGFRWHLKGAQHVYRVTPDLCTFGKAMANGFSVSALAGRKDIMCLGGTDHARERVFLLSTTHGGQTHELAAACATMRYYASHPVVETLYARGARLRRGIEQAIQASQLAGYFELLGRDCNLIFETRDGQRKPSQLFRSLFMQELIKRGVIAPSFVISNAHSESDIDRTIDAVGEAFRTYRNALSDGIEKLLEGRPVKPVFRRVS